MTGPALSNYLADLAERIGEHAGRYRRSTLAAATAALEAGALLVEARAECRHGEWLPFLARAGMADRTARNWMRLARSGLGAENIVAAGGVRAALLALANPLAVAIVERQVDEASADAFEAISATVADLPDPAASPAEPANPAISVPRGAPEPPGARPVVHETALAAGEYRSVQADAPTSNRSDPGDAQSVDSAGDPRPLLETDAPATMTLYRWRRSQRLCTSCGEPSGGAARCSGCAERLNRKRRSRTRIAGELVTRIEAAAASGDGLNLTPADVRRLAGDGPGADRCGQTVDWIGGR